MKKKLLICVSIILIGGCVKSIDETGKTFYQLDPNAPIVKVVEKGAEFAPAAEVIAGILATWIPEAAIVGMVIGWLGGLWKKLNPKLSTATTKAQKYYDVTSSVISAIEEFKASNPNDWDKLKAQLEKAIGPESENVIRALRGLPPKT